VIRRRRLLRMAGAGLALPATMLRWTTLPAVAAPSGTPSGPGNAAACAAPCAAPCAVPHALLLIGAAPGTAADRVARDFAPFLSRALDGSPVTPRNLPGEGGLTSFQALADAAPDGATLGWINTPVLPARLVDRDAGPLLDRLTLLGAVQREPIAFVSPAASPLETVQDVIRRSGEDADAVALGTPPPGSPPHLAALRLQVLAQTRLNIVTFPSAAAARAAAVAGNVAVTALGLADVIADLREGRLAGLGIAADSRAGALPDMPALTEAGLPLAAAITRGLAAPAGLPAPLAARLADALQAVTEDADFRAGAEASGFQVTWIDGPHWTELVRQEQRRLAALWATEPWLPGAGQ
jgi:tripartite-type tricarboxylate transporter receptor subunit TctC